MITCCARQRVLKVTTKVKDRLYFFDPFALTSIIFLVIDSVEILDTKK